MIVMQCGNPTGRASWMNVGIQDIMEELQLSSEEVQILVDCHINIDFWFEGKDYKNCKRWTFDGDNCYADFSFRNFLLANICDMYKGAMFFKNFATCKKIESINGLKKWINFGNTRVTIKEMYFGIWKNFWNFVNVSF